MYVHRLFPCTPSNLDPLVLVESINDVRKKLDKQEADRLAAEKTPVIVTAPDYGNLIVLAIDIQKSQYVFNSLLIPAFLSHTYIRRITKALLLQLKSSTSDRDRDRQEVALAKLTIKIGNLVRMQRELQLTFLDEVHGDRVSEDPLLFKTKIPSDLSNAQRATACPPQLTDIEISLRHAYALEALESMLDNLRTKMGLQNYKQKNVKGVAQVTRSSRAMASLQKQVLHDASEYRAHRVALLQLRGKGDWEKELRELRPEDIRGINTDEPSKRDMANNLAAQLRGLTVVDNDARGDVSSEVFLEDTVKPLVGAVQPGSRRREISWIWLGQNLSDGRRDPTCEC